MCCPWCVEQRIEQRHVTLFGSFYTLTKKNRSRLVVFVLVLLTRQETVTVSILLEEESGGEQEKDDHHQTQHSHLRIPDIFTSVRSSFTLSPCFVYF